MQEPISVTALNQYIKGMFERERLLSRVLVRSEMSNYKVYPSGHHYFSLKDAESSIRCVMFRREAMSLRFRPENGMKVVVSGRVSVFPRDGAYQLYCATMVPDGVGELAFAFEQLKNRLHQEGLFDPAHKKPIPAHPQTIALVTSPAGAAVRDMIRILGARYPMAKILVVPVRVQGEEAPEEIANGLDLVNALDMAELIITGRGGGSMEDLWAFNEEIVARAIADSPIPVISAVGHETDTTIADFAADARASTPSNAAEMAVPDRREIIEGLRDIRRHMTDAMAGLIRERRYDLLTLQRRMEALRPEQKLAALSAQAETMRLRLNAAMDAKLPLLAHRIGMAGMRLDAAMDRQLVRPQERIVRARARLNALNPSAVLERGYALVMDGDKVVPSAASASKISHMTLRFRDDSVAVERRK